MELINFWTWTDAVWHETVRTWPFSYSEATIETPYMIQVCNDLPVYFLSLRMYSNTRGHSYELTMHRSNLDVLKKLFSQRVALIWNRLFAKIVMASTLNSFKEKLQVDLGQELFDLWNHESDVLGMDLYWKFSSRLTIRHYVVGLCCLQHPGWQLTVQPQSGRSIPVSRWREMKK